MLFFFKQKTAYEMRISDWSSDVCSSDLVAARPECFKHGGAQGHHVANGCTGKASGQLFERFQRDAGTEAVRADRWFRGAVEQTPRPRHPHHFAASRRTVAIFAHSAVAHTRQVVGHPVVTMSTESPAS